MLQLPGVYVLDVVSVILDQDRCVSIEPSTVSYRLLSYSQFSSLEHQIYKTSLNFLVIIVYYKDT